jgi:hypothetical protein
MNFSISSELLQPLQDHVSGYGRADVESGAFLLGPYESRTATVLALADGTGVERHRGYFRVSGKAVECLFDFAETEGLRVWAQVHAHPRGSFLSETDERDGFRVEGFLSGIIPNFAAPPREPNGWGWWTFVDGAWQAASAPSTAAAPGRVVTFDEAGVR